MSVAVGALPLIAVATLSSSSVWAAVPPDEGGSGDVGSAVSAPIVEEPPPVALEQLAPGLLGSDDLGLPDSWLLTDLDPALVGDPDFATQLDSLSGVLACPEGLIRDAAAPWITRQFDGVAGPLPDGLIFLETTLTAESAEAAAADRSAVTSCSGPDDGSTVHRIGLLEVAAFAPDGSVTSDPPVSVEFAAVDVVAPATDGRPYPVAATVVWTHRDGVTAMSVALGVDVEPADGAAPHARPAEWLASAMLSRLALVGP